jgi:dTDP-4-dehydrorhamnose reductase
MVGAEAMSKYEFGRRITEKFGFNAALIKPVSVKESGLKAARSPNLTLSTEKLRAALGHDLPDFAGGLQKFYDQYRRGYPEYIKSLA